MPLFLADAELSQLLTLMDDPDPVVRKAVMQKLQGLGSLAWEQLQQTVSAKETPQALREGLAGVMAALEWDRLKGDLGKWMAEPFPDLMQGLCLVAAAVYPGVYGGLQEQMLDYVRDIWMELADEQTVMEKIKLFNYMFYNKLHFVPEDPFMSEERYARIDSVLHTKHGNPVILGLLYLYLAEQTGMPVKGLVFKGGFLPVLQNDSGEALFYINIYKNGDLFVTRQLHEFLKEYGFHVPQESMRIATAVNLAGIYAELLYYMFSMAEDKAKEGRMEEVLRLFGNDRYLMIEEDEED